MSHILLVLFLSFWSFLSHGSETWVKLHARTKDGTVAVHAFHYKNIWGRNEVRLEAASLPKVGKANPILGYGRDTNDDGKVDTWFLIDDEEMLKIKQFRGTHPWGRDDLINRVLRDYESSTLAHMRAIAGRLFGLFLWSVNHSWSSEIAFWQEMVDLAEFKIRIERMKDSGNMSERQWIESLSILASAYEESSNRLRRAQNQEYFARGAADVALWATGGVLVKWMGKGLAAVGRTVIPSQLMVEGQAMVKGMLNKAIARNQAQLRALRRLTGGAAIVVSANLFKAKFTVTMRAVMLKNQMLSAIANNIKPALIKAAHDWKYYSFMASIQLTAEGMVNWSEVRDPNPLIVASNVLTNGSIMSNVAFMSANAYLMTATWHAVRPKGLRIAATAFVPMMTSTIINVVIQGSRNFSRLAVDTGWESTIGQTQLRLDRLALEGFEKMAINTGKVHLRHLGWVIVLVEQGAMFGVYSKVGEKLEEAHEIQMIPVIVNDDEQRGS
jgi:hypothetical protein